MNARPIWQCASRHLTTGEARGAAVLDAHRSGGGLSSTERDTTHGNAAYHDGRKSQRVCVATTTAHRAAPASSTPHRTKHAATHLKVEQVEAQVEWRDGILGLCHCLFLARGLLDLLLDGSGVDGAEALVLGQVLLERAGRVDGLVLLGCILARILEDDLASSCMRAERVSMAGSGESRQAALLTRMVGQKVGHVVHLAMHDDPAALVVVVLCHFLGGDHGCHGDVERKGGGGEEERREALTLYSKASGVEEASAWAALALRCGASIRQRKPVAPMVKDNSALFPLPFTQTHPNYSFAA